MIEFEDWEFPEGSRPRDEDVAFDLDGALASVVSLRTEVPDDAYTASILGTERGGNGVRICCRLPYRPGRPGRTTTPSGRAGGPALTGLAPVGGTPSGDGNHSARSTAIRIRIGRTLPPGAVSRGP